MNRDIERRKRAITAVFSALMVSRIFLLLAAVAQRWELSHNRHEHVDIKQRRKRAREGEDDAVTAAAVFQLGYGSKRFWVDARSNHWISRVLDGALLQGEEFERTFRMNRNSFHTLHGILGTYIVDSLSCLY